MKAFSGLLRGGLSACAVLAIVSGCGGSQTQTNALVPGQSNAATAELGRLGVGSSMAADAQSSDLLYVADAKDGSVHVYSYPAGKPQGRLLDVRANALCAGKNGDVFAPAGNEVLRYAHGGTRPIAVLHDPLGTAPQFCAVDSTTGNLAVSGGSATQSGVAIYAAAKGGPTIYAGRNDARYGSARVRQRWKSFCADGRRQGGRAGQWRQEIQRARLERSAPDAGRLDPVGRKVPRGCK